MLHNVIALACRNRWTRTISDLDQRTTARHTQQQALHQLNAAFHRKVQHGNSGNDAVELLIFHVAKRLIEIEYVSLNDVHVRKSPVKMIDKVR
ncbi:hypothetical protein D3C72_2358350 [compost metagenome]